MTSAENTATESEHSTNLGDFLTPHQAAVWGVTAAGWAAVLAVHVQGESATTALILGAVALTLTLISVVTACYDGIRRAQERIMNRLLGQQEEHNVALAALAAALEAQRNEVHRLRKSTKMLGDGVHDTCELIEAQSLLIAETRPQSPVRPVRRGEG